MTTFSAYLDALAQSDVDQKVRRTWQVSTWVRGLALVGGDALALCVAMTMAILGRQLLPFGNEMAAGTLLVAPAVIAGWMVALLSSGAYRLKYQRVGATEYKRVIMASFTMAAAVSIVSYLLKAEFPRAVYILLFSIGTAVLVTARFTRRQLMATAHRHGALLTPILVVGESGHVDSVAKVLRRETWLGYRVVGAATSDRSLVTPSGLPVLGAAADAVSLIREHQAEAVIFAEGSFASPADFRRMAWELEAEDVHMIVVPTLTDVSAQRLEVRPVGGLPLVDVDRPQAIEAARWIKRSFDLIGSALLLLIGAPLMAAVALAIKLEDGGPVVFRQARVGLKGEVFDCLKFRSMCIDAEAKLAALQAQNEGAGPLFKMTHDPRITRVGRFIRRFSLDELPQLWNAFRGDMSLVGPRPALPSEVAQYDSDTRRRLDVRPGLTGLWQVSGRSNLSWDDTVRLDLYYVDNWSMVQDLMILAKTAKAVVGSSGAY